MKLVGFTFGDNPTVGPHIEAVHEDFICKVWMLFHLREAGIKGRNLYQLYCCYIRSRIEYLSPAYHSMLLKGHVELLERLHRYALRVCFGFEGDIRDTMIQLGLETLATRRQRRVDKFIAKSAANPQFQHWFPAREGGERYLRSHRRV